MILHQSFRDDLIDHIQNEPEETFANSGKTKAEILTDSDLIEQLWTLYQKSIEDYDVDAVYAYGDAMYEVLNIKVQGFVC